jgi:hypothetical protein
MNIWSQIARLGAAVAAFGPPVLTEAADEPDQVTIPTLGVTDQPAAAVVMEAPATPPKPLEVEVVGIATDPYVAALPADTSVPNAPSVQAPGPRGPTGPVAGPRGDRNRRPCPWHSDGHRYG